MKEKKLTDDEIVKAIDKCFAMPMKCEDGCPYFNKYGRNFCVEDKRFYHDVKDLIQRQNAEIERLTSLYDGQSAYMTSSIGELPLTVEGLRKAVDEISRLLIVQGELQTYNAKYYNKAKDLRRANTKLQKQVDELSQANIDLWNANQFGIKYSKNPYKVGEVEL